MKFKAILAAAAAALTLGLASAPAADAAVIVIGHGGFGYHDGWHGRRIVEHRVVFETLRFHHVRYFGEPFFFGGRYVVRSYDRFGRVTFVEVNPYSGDFIGYVRR